MVVTRDNVIEDVICLSANCDQELPIPEKKLDELFLPQFPPVCSQDLLVK